MNAAFLRPRGLDLDVLQALAEVLVLAVCVFLWKERLLVLLKVDALVGKRVVGGRMRSVDGLFEDRERVLLLHC